MVGDDLHRDRRRRRERRHLGEGSPAREEGKRRAEEHHQRLERQMKGREPAGQTPDGERREPVRLVGEGALEERRQPRVGNGPGHQHRDHSGERRRVADRFAGRREQRAPARRRGLAAPTAEERRKRQGRQLGQAEKSRDHPRPAGEEITRRAATKSRETSASFEFGLEHVRGVRTREPRQRRGSPQVARLTPPAPRLPAQREEAERRQERRRRSPPCARPAARRGCRPGEGEIEGA